MDEQNMIEVRLIALLRRDGVRLWLEPFTSDRQKIRELALRYAPIMGYTAEELMSSLETIRADTCRKVEGNKEFRETSMASLELHLPRDGEKQKRKVHLKTRLDDTTQELKKRISKEFGFTHFNLILSGKTLSPASTTGWCGTSVPRRTSRTTIIAKA